MNSQINDSIYLFPNPTNDFINISESTIWKLVDVYGAIISNGTGNKIDLTKFHPGVYVIIIGTQSYKVVKQ